MYAKLLQSCPTLCVTMDQSPPGSFVRGILQARILEQVAMISFRDLLDSGTEPLSLRSSALAGRFFTTSATWEAQVISNIIEHLFVCLLAIWLSSLEECPFRSSTHFLMVFFLVCLFMLCYMNLCILEINALPIASFANIYSQSVGFLFILLTVLIAV